MYPARFETDASIVSPCQILDEKTLIQKYRNEINELKKKLAAAEEAERKYKEMERLATEKQRVEEANESLVKKLQEQEELRAKLEEKIRHLTRLILVSTSVRPEVREHSFVFRLSFTTSSVSSHLSARTLRYRPRIARSLVWFLSCPLRVPSVARAARARSSSSRLPSPRITRRRSRPPALWPPPPALAPRPRPTWYPTLSLHSGSSFFFHYCLHLSSPCSALPTLMFPIRYGSFVSLCLVPFQLASDDDDGFDGQPLSAGGGGGGGKEEAQKIEALTIDLRDRDQQIDFLRNTVSLSWVYQCFFSLLV